MTQAAAIDAKVAANEPLGLLAGVPIAIKDNICTKGMQTSAASQYLRDYMPAYDATVIAKLRAAGAVLVGKTNMDEFGMGSTTENSSFHTTRNAWSAAHVPGAAHALSGAMSSGCGCLISAWSAPTHSSAHEQFVGLPPGRGDQHVPSPFSPRFTHTDGAPMDTLPAHRWLLRRQWCRRRRRPGAGCPWK